MIARARRSRLPPGSQQECNADGNCQRRHAELACQGHAGNDANADEVVPAAFFLPSECPPERKRSKKRNPGIHGVEVRLLDRLHSTRIERGGQCTGPKPAESARYEKDKQDSKSVQQGRYEAADEVNPVVGILVHNAGCGLRDEHWQRAVDE